MKTISNLISKSLPVAAGLSIVMASGTLFAADLDRSDKSFVKNAYQDGLAEVKAGQMALGKTTNADVKTFAQQMVTDHTTANTDLKTVADGKKVEDMPSEPSMVAKGKAKLLDAKSGGDFDKAYVDDMVSDHKKAVAAFEKEASEGKDTDVKAFAAKTLPTLKSHLSMAEDLQHKVEK